MAIKSTYHDRPELNTVKHAGRVVDVRSYVARRNHSDTLDYSDWRDTNVTEALVYRGRMVPSWIHSEPSAINPLRAAEVHELFTWVDCTNLFCWRGMPFETAEVDADMSDPDSEIVVDYKRWCAWRDEVAAKREAQRIADAKRDAEFKAEQERNRPVKGKKMRVARGRKVPVGTVGVVAFISGSTGAVLLKDEASWQDRNAPGTWVNPQYLVAV